MTDTIYIGADHAGYQLKEVIKEYLREKDIEVHDLGTHSEDSVDYPEYGHLVADAVGAGKGMGIIICGSGNGINMSANKHQGIRSALAWSPEIARLARSHNDANVLALPSRFISEDMAKEAVDSFLGTEFEGGRHQRRINKIPCGS